MRGEFNQQAKVIGKTAQGSIDVEHNITVPANTEEYTVLRKLWVSNDATGSEFDALNSRVYVDVSFGGANKANFIIHPGNGGGSSLEFENGPWFFDFEPGLYTGTLNEEFKVTVSAFGTSILAVTSILYQ